MWAQLYRALKRAFDYEVEQTRVHEARMASDARKASRAAEAPADGAPAAKRMRVLASAEHKDKYPGSLTVKPGDMCVFIEACANPLWTRVRMDDDTRVGNVPTKKVCAHVLQHTYACSHLPSHFCAPVQARGVCRGGGARRPDG